MDKLRRSKKKALSAAEYDKLLSDLEQFEQKFYTILALTDKYEIVPTTLDDGTLVSREHLAMLVKECTRLGYKILYKIDVNNEQIILFNPDSMKIGYITDGVH